PLGFAVLVTPEHAAIVGANVLKTTGAPTYFSPDDLEETGLAFADLPHEPGQAAIVVLGGDSKTHRFTRAAADRLEGQLRALAPKWRLRITASRRTPIEVRARFRAVADAIGARYWEGPDDGPNPYLAWLMFSKAAIVTEDSANMLSDAAYFGMQIQIARLDGRAAKFDRLHQSLIDQGAARWFDGGLATWTYEPLREADRVADIIVERLLARHPQPAIPPIGQGQ
ncbi:MAG: mitochondrial fission ELM1 family protein, partial [Rhodothalassiaceae bacterium]